MRRGDGEARLDGFADEASDSIYDQMATRGRESVFGKTAESKRLNGLKKMRKLLLMAAAAAYMTVATSLATAVTITATAATVTAAVAVNTTAG